jgi:hypothetical protein
MISQNDRDLCTRSSNIAARVVVRDAVASVVTYLFRARPPPVSRSAMPNLSARERDQ